jgi:hypothetical protein
MDASEADAGGVNPTFRRKCERAFFTLTEAERLGVRPTFRRTAWATSSAPLAPIAF